VDGSDPAGPADRSSRRGFVKALVALGAGIALGTYAIQSLSRKGGAEKGDRAAVTEGTEARFYAPSRGQGVRCLLCPNQCTIAPGARGVCEVRENRDGKLLTLVYGKPCTWHVDPIEKKPLYHFLPATTAFSIATAGCNFECLYCQNWEISQARPEDLESIDMPPEKVVELALQSGSACIAYTYNEPTIFYEYMYDTCRLAHGSGIRNLDITNGFMNTEPLIELCKIMDAANVDLKGFSEDFYRNVCSGQLQPVLDYLVTMKEEGVWMEITNLVVPTLNDDTEMISQMCDWIVAELGTDYPLHFSRFSPLYQLAHLPYTPIRTLEQAREIAMGKGIKYVYIGNVAGHPADNTYCHSCGQMLIERGLYFSVLQNNVEGGRCKFCGTRIPGVWA